MGSQGSIDSGRSLWWMKSPFEVPDRIHTAGKAFLGGGKNFLSIWWMFCSTGGSVIVIEVAMVMMLRCSVLWLDWFPFLLVGYAIINNLNKLLPAFHSIVPCLSILVEIISFALVPAQSSPVASHVPWIRNSMDSPVPMHLLESRS